jgi:shikimate dehydrogenase
MDLVYNPADTMFLKAAKAGGCEIVYGSDMLLYQGVRQFELWTGRDAPVEVMRKALLEKISK